MSATRRNAAWLACAWIAVACVPKTAVTDASELRDDSVAPHDSPRVRDREVVDAPLLDGRALILESNGAKPRAPLKLRVAPGTTQHLLVYDGGRRGRAYDVLVTAGAAVGSDLLTYNFSSTELRRGAYADGAARKGSALFGRHGLATPIEWVFDEKAFDGVGQRVLNGSKLARLLLLVPVEPVGVGAVWRIDEDESPKWSTTVRLVERTEEAFKLTALSKARLGVESKSGLFFPDPIETSILWRFSEPLPREASAGAFHEDIQEWDPLMSLEPFY